MGLAASQARLLTITARKADCEFQSMALSHQKIALARDMENISQEYQTALNTTKLVYDYYGSGTSDMDLNYDLLMTPSVYNDYYPKLVTDSKNRVMLNSSYAAAARAAGIPAEGLMGTPSSEVRNKFIDALANTNIISVNTAATIQGTTYNNKIGNGTTISANISTTEVTFDQLLDLIKVNSDDSSTYGVLLGKSAQQQDGKDQRLVQITNGTYTENTATGASISLQDLLSGDTEYIIAYESGEGTNYNWPVITAARLQDDLLTDSDDPNGHGSNSIMSWMLDSFSQVLGGLSSNDTALQFAYNAVYNILYPSNDLQDAVTNGTRNQEVLDTVGTKVKETVNNNGFVQYVAETSPGYVGLTYSKNRPHGGVSGWFHSKNNDNTTVAVNLNNLAQVFLTAYVDYMTSFEEGYKYEKNSLSENVLYNGERNNDFMFTIPVETEVDNQDNQLLANFYDTLFNSICLQGWVENDQVDDADYLSEMFKNGMAYISSIGEDGYYYQGAYSTDRAIREVTDDDAISKAEAKYNTEKAKLQNKEDTIDLKMKNLDTEISSLTTEYDTTKSIITKAIEKSFKRYEA